MSNPADQPSSEIGRASTVASLVEQLYQSHVALVRSVCRSMLRNPIEAEDAVQQTFLSAQIALLNGSSPRDATAWLATIARNESLARVRARMREPLSVDIDEPGAAPDVHAAALRRHEVNELRKALAELPIRQREAILLREVRGFSPGEVAAELSVTTYAAESLLSRARRSLQTRLQPTFAGMSLPLWLPPLRKSVARIAGGGAVASTATKVAVVGASTALVTGGALVGPRIIGLGHFHRSVRSAMGSPAHRTSHSTHSKAPAALSPDLAPRSGHKVVVVQPQREARAADDHSLSGERAGGQSTSSPVSQPTPDSSDHSGTQQPATPAAARDSQDDSNAAGSTGSSSGGESQDGGQGQDG
jgi:RNA polymerase sigma-70 factor (ECF subfamily)